MSYKKIIFIGIVLILMSNLASAICTVVFDDTQYETTETITATMVCDASAEKNTGFTLTWRDVTLGTVLETDTGNTPNIVSVPFNEDYIILSNFPNGHTISATLTGSQLEGSDTAIIYTAYELTTTMVVPPSDMAVLSGNTFTLTCNVNNTGGGTTPSVLLQAQYANGAIIGTSGGVMSLNQSGNYSCPSIAEGVSCSRTWTVTANTKAQQDIKCYAYGRVSLVEDSSPLTTINIFQSAATELSITLNSDSYSPGESVTARLTSYFTSAPYNVEFYNSTNALLCNTTGTTPTTSLTAFFKSCVLSGSEAYQNNSYAMFYLNSNNNLNVTDTFDISAIASTEYVITNILLKYSTAFLGYSQSIKGTVIDSNQDFAIGECCRLQIDDATTGAPIFTSDNEVIDGAGSCETHWILDQEIFESPKSYQAMIIAWQCSNEALPAPDRKRGTGVTSFNTNNYFTELNSFLLVDEINVFSGLDVVTIRHERTNNFGHPMEVLQDVWFSNTITEQDYHYDELEDIVTTVNVGTSTTIEEYIVPLNLPAGSYRLEKHVYYYYQGKLKETTFVKSEVFNITSWEDSIIINSMYLLNSVRDEVDVTVDSNFNLSDKPTNFLVMGLPFSICLNYNSIYTSYFYGELSKISIFERSEGSFLKELSKEVAINPVQFKITPGNNNVVCGRFVFSNDKVVSNLWSASVNFNLGTNKYVNVYKQLIPQNNFLNVNSYNFYVDSLANTMQIPKWWTLPNLTYAGDPGIWVESRFGNKLPVFDDLVVKSQSEVPWGEIENCTSFENNSLEYTCNYTNYLTGGSVFKVCFKAKNLLSSEQYIKLDELMLRDDLSGETASIIVNYLETRIFEVTHSTSPKLNGCNGDCEDAGGLSTFCSDYFVLPDEMTGSNSWDVSGILSFHTPEMCISKDLIPSFSFESDEFAIYGLERYDGYFRFNSPLTMLSNNYVMGDVMLANINITSMTNFKAGVHAHLENSFGLEVYTWSDSKYLNLDSENLEIYYPLLLPVYDSDILTDGQYRLVIHLFPINSLSESNIRDDYILEKTPLFNISLFSAVISENITSSTIDNNNPVTIDYELNIPTKDMMFYPNKNQPFRIKYHFINSGGQAISQFTKIDGQYAPLEAYAMFPADSIQNFSVILQPTNLVPGTYTIVEEIEIDPEGVWEGVHKGEVGSITVTETLTGAPRGLVDTVEAIYYNTEDINFTVHQIQDSITNYIEVILNEINETITKLQMNITIDIQDINSNVLTIISDLLTLREAVNDNQDFAEEAVFLVTDSIVATTKAAKAETKQEFISQMEIVEDKLELVKNLNLVEKNKKVKKFIVCFSMIFIGGGMIIYGVSKPKKNKNKIATLSTMMLGGIKK